MRMAAARVEAGEASYLHKKPVLLHEASVGSGSSYAVQFQLTSASLPWPVRCRTRMCASLVLCQRQACSSRILNTAH